MMTELIEYRVIGTIKPSSYFCECPDCRGHNRGTTEDIDYSIKAKDEEEAKQLAQKEFEESGDYYFGKWVKVFVLAPGEKPPRPLEVELEMLDRWNKGQGLPAGEEPLKFGFVAARGVLQ